MMKNNVYIYIIVVLAFTACKSEEILEPSLKDKDVVAEFVQRSNNDLVKRVFEQYRCGLLYEYDAILDFAYTAESVNEVGAWEIIETPMMREAFVDENGVISEENKPLYEEYVDKGMTFLDTTLFKFIEEGGLVPDNMPVKVLISDGIYAPIAVLNDVLTESDSRIGSEASGGLNCVYNRHSIVLSVNQDAVSVLADKLMKDNFYIFLCRIIEMHDLYDAVPISFSIDSEPYYNENIEQVYADEFGIDLEDESEDAEQVPNSIDKQWFFSKGFIDAQYFYNRPTGLTIIDGEEKAIKKNYNFINAQEDVRSYLNELIHRDEDEIMAFPENIKIKMNVLKETLENWGIDIVAFNPALSVLN